MINVAGQIPFYSAIPGIDRANDLLEIVSVSGNATYNVTPNNLMGITSGSAVSTTMSQTIQNKTFDASNVFTPSDANWTMQNSSDSTKKVSFLLSGITTGNTRTLTVPDRSSTIATLGGNQTFTGANSFTGSAWSGGTIDNSTVTIDALSGHTNSTTGTVYGMSVSSGKMSGSFLTNSSVTPNQLATGAVSMTTAANATTTSTTYVTQLSDSVTTSVTTTIGVNGLAVVVVSGSDYDNTSGDTGYTSFSISGANTLASSDANAYQVTTTSASGNLTGASRVIVLTGLTSGSSTFTLQYRVNAGTGNFANRSIAVIPL